MGRKNRSSFPKTPNESHCALNLHMADTWDQKHIQEKYAREIGASYKEINGKKRSSKAAAKSGCPVKAKTSRSAFGLRCCARPNSASSINKSTLMLNDRLHRTAYKEMDEAERFFEDIRETVTDIVEKKLTKVVDDHFKGLLKRIEGISLKLENTENSFSTLHNELQNKITHYGEEHSRHFRYICMKMEYDKIFYQHMTGLLRQDHLANGYYSCGQNLAQDLLKYPPPCQLQTCPCVGTCRNRDIQKTDVQSTSKAALPVNVNLGCGDVNIIHDKRETTSSQGSQQDLIKINSDLNLKKIVATLRQYYPISEDMANKLEKSLWNLDEDQTDAISSALQPENFGTPDVMNVKRVKRLA